MASTHINLTELPLDLVEDEIHIVRVRLTNLQEVCDAVTSLRTKRSEECFQPEELRQFWGQKTVFLIFAFIFWPFFYTFLDSVDFSHFFDVLFELSRSCLLGPKLLLYIPYIQM